MRPRLLTLCLPLALAAPLVAADARELNERSKVEAGRLIRLEISVGEVLVEAHDELEVKSEIRVRCRWDTADCGEKLGTVELDVSKSSHGHRLELRGLRSWENAKLDVEARFWVPRSSPLEIDMDVGDQQQLVHQQQEAVDHDGQDRGAAQLPKNVPKDASFPEHHGRSLGAPVQGVKHPHGPREGEGFKVRRGYLANVR